MTIKKILTNPEDLVKKIKVLIESSQFELALKLLKENQKNHLDNFEFLNLTAQISLRKNNLKDGINFFKKSLNIHQNQPLVIYDLGIALSLNAQYDESLTFFDKLIALQPNNINPYIRKAINFKKLDRLDDSINCYQKIIDLEPKYIDAYIKKAELLILIGNSKAAQLLYQHAIKIDSKNIILYLKYGVLLNELGHIDQALSIYKKSLEIEPNNPGALQNIGYIFKSKKRFDEAIKFLKKSVEIKADYNNYNNIAEIYLYLRNTPEAIIYYDKAIKIEPNNPESYVGKAHAHQSIKEFDKAISSYNIILKLDKNFKYIFGARFYAKLFICDWSNFEEELNWIKLKLKEKKCIATPLHLCGFFDDPLIHRNGAEIYAKDKYPLNKSLGRIKKYKKNKKIKIGYFSGDFSEHPVGYLVTELFEMHDKSKFELFAFSLSTKIESNTRLRIENAFDDFIDVSNVSDKEIALLSREKKIDIAIDLGGYTKNSRPGIFPMKVAPIQINFLGYPGTMGTNYIDYNIADKFIIPEETQQYFNEKIIYLPNSYQPNENKIIPSKKVFSRKSEGLPESGFVFCCFNSSWKITPRIFEIWIRLLSSIKGSVLWFPGYPNSAILNLKKECTRFGMNQSRLIFSSLEKLREDHQEKIRLADLFLDCIPFGAQSTASDFLRVGIPIVTLIGSSFPNRVASSLLNSLNLNELVTKTELDYENLAIKIASNPQYLKEVKQKLISNISNSSIYNISKFTNNIESGYTQAYYRYHNNLEPKNIEVI